MKNEANNFTSHSTVQASLLVPFKKILQLDNFIKTYIRSCIIYFQFYDICTKQEQEKQQVRIECHGKRVEKTLQKEMYEYDV